MRKKTVILFSISMVYIFLASCNFLISPLHTRENSNDWKKQIHNLFAEQLTDNSLKISFSWLGDRNFYYDEDNIDIDEALLIYSTDKAYLSRTTLIPPEYGGSYRFDFSEEYHLYSKEISEFSKNEEVWFALYPKQGMRWYAPLYEKIVLQDASSIPTITSPSMSPINGFIMDSSGYHYELYTGSPGDPYSIESSFGFARYLVLQFDLPDRARCLDATIYLPVNGGAVIGYAYPIISGEFEYVDDTQRLRLIDYQNASTFTYDQAAAGNANITAAVDAAIKYRSNTILFAIEDGSTENTTAGSGYGDESMVITFQQY